MTHLTDKILLDHGDNGDRILVVTGGNQVSRAKQLQAAIAASEVQDMRVITADSLEVRAEEVDHDALVLTPNEPIPDLSNLRTGLNRTRTVTKRRSVGISSMAAIAAMSLLGVGAMPRISTGRTASRRNSQNLEEEERRQLAQQLAQLRDEQPRHAGMSPAFAAPYGRSQQDLDRIAAAEAKRARKAAKRSK